MNIASKLGPSYESIRAVARIKTIKVMFNDTEAELKVRIPVKREMDELTSKITAANEDRVAKIYAELSEPLLKTVRESDAEFLEALKNSDQKLEILDNDIVVNGTSVKQIATFTAIWQQQVELYFSLLQSPTGEPVNESFDEIADEFPEQIIRDIVSAIEEVIKPTFKDTKKN